MADITVKMTDRAIEGRVCVKIEYAGALGSKSAQFATQDEANAFVYGVNMGLGFVQKTVPTPTTMINFNGENLVAREPVKNFE